MDVDLPRMRSDRGETLVEVLVGLTILSIAAVAVLAGVQLSTKVSDINRKQTTGGAYVKTFAEAIQQAVASGDVAYANCAAANAYKAVALTKFEMPPGFAASDFQQAEAVPLTPVGGPASKSPCADDGTQRVVLTVSSADNRASESLAVVLRRPCKPGGSC